MTFSTNNSIEMIMVLNSFRPQFDPQSIPPYIDWVTSTTFDPFGPEPFAPTSYPIPGTRLHFQTQVDTVSRVDLGYGSPEEGTTRDVPQEVSSGPPSEDRGLDSNRIHQRSRFAFAQKRIERPIDVGAGQIQATHVHHSSPGRSRSPSPIPIKTIPARASRVAGPRPLRFQCAPRARREPTLAVPKPVYPLPMWLTHFEDYEQELLANFCPPSEDSSPSTSTFPVIPSEHVSHCPPLNMVPLLGFANSDHADIGVGGRRWGEDEDSDETDEDYHPFEFDTDSDFGSDYVPFGSESSAPTSYGVGAVDWSVPFRGQVGGEDGYSRASAVTILEFPPQDLPSHSPSSPHVPSFDPFDLAAQLPSFLPWSIFTNPFTSAPVAARNPKDAHVVEVDADRFLAEVEEGLGFGSALAGPLPEPFEADGWYDRFDLNGYTFPTLPHQPQSPLVAAGFEAPPLVHAGTIPLPDTGEGEDSGLGAVVVPRNPWYWWW